MPDVKDRTRLTVTGDVAWSADLTYGNLRGRNASTGQPRLSVPLGSVDHVTPPNATPGRLFVGAGSELAGLALT